MEKKFWKFTEGRSGLRKFLPQEKWYHGHDHISNHIFNHNIYSVWNLEGKYYFFKTETSGSQLLVRTTQFCFEHTFPHPTLERDFYLEGLRSKFKYFF